MSKCRKATNQMASKSWYKRQKRVADIVFSMILLSLLSPILAIIAVLIYIDSPGSITFSHKRVGRCKSLFMCLKFRTMVPNASERLESLLNSDEQLKEEFSRTHKLKNDPRITKIGKFLRKYSLDELPQLWNVIKGEMSLVGPRPIVNDEIKKYGDRFNTINNLRPGMTGLWQVSGRNNTTYAERVDYDYEYAMKGSIFLDLSILIKTAAVVVAPKDRGSY